MNVSVSFKIRRCAFNLTLYVNIVLCSCLNLIFQWVRVHDIALRCTHRMTVQDGTSNKLKLIWLLLICDITQCRHILTKWKPPLIWMTNLIQNINDRFFIWENWRWHFFPLPSCALNERWNNHFDHLYLQFQIIFPGFVLSETEIHLKIVKLTTQTMNN